MTTAAAILAEAQAGASKVTRTAAQLDADVRQMAAFLAATGHRPMVLRISTRLWDEDFMQRPGMMRSMAPGTLPGFSGLGLMVDGSPNPPACGWAIMDDENMSFFPMSAEEVAASVGRSAPKVEPEVEPAPPVAAVERRRSLIERIRALAARRKGKG